MSLFVDVKSFAFDSLMTAQTNVTNLNPLMPELFFRSCSGHSLRWALFVYRLIVATLIGNFFDDPFLN